MDVLPRAKYEQVADLLERRIALGSYLLSDFPTDRQLSAEFEVDTRTARKAVARLIAAGLLVRQSNGRPAVQTVLRERNTGLRVALLAVAYPTPFTGRWQRAIEAAVLPGGGTCRLVTYTHLDDSVVKDTLDGFDGVFFGLPSEVPTPHFLRVVARAKRPVVFLDSDLSAHGFPSLWLTPPLLTTRLLDHLAELGHAKVAFLNTQPHGDVTNERTRAWRDWTDARGRAGRLVDDPVEPFGFAMERAYQTTLRVLDSGGFDATALLCCTSAAAKGAYRALHERNVVVGRDLAVCSADDGAGEARFFVPSLTSVTALDPGPYVAVCLDWMKAGGRHWNGPLLVQPRDVPLFIGESTVGTAISTAPRPTSGVDAVPNVMR